MSRIDVVVAAVVLVVVLVLTSVSIGQAGNGVATQALRDKDARHVLEILRSIHIFSAEFALREFPRPGLIDRLPVEISGRLEEVPGRGAEDITANTTANFYSMFIMNNYISPGVVVSPVERSPRVQIWKNYAYDQYDPARDVFWDPGFRADLDVLSHTSYAHLVMSGDRLKDRWRNADAGLYPIVSNRGPVGGEPDASSFTCGPHGHWAGNVGFNDGQVRMLTATTVEGLTLPAPERGGDEEGQGQGEASDPVPDNLFAMETGPRGPDAILSFTKAMTSEGPTLQFD